MKCKEYEIKIKDIKKQNATLENAKRKISELLSQINYVPFAHSASDERTAETNPEPGKGLLLDGCWMVHSPGQGSSDHRRVGQYGYLSKSTKDVLLYKSEDIIVPNKNDKEIT